MSLPISEDRIEKEIELQAPRARVWRALTDYREFSQWFRVNLEGPFVPGQSAVGQISYPGYEHIRMAVEVQTMEAEEYFSFTWHPCAIEEGVDYSQEPPTLVAFRLDETAGGTLLSVTESGFGNLPAQRRAEAFRMNRDGWTEQMKNIKRHVEETK